jgi:hypothetical protein
VSRDEAVRLRKSLERIFPECKYRVVEQSYGWGVLVEASPVALGTLEDYHR